MTQISFGNASNGEEVTRITLYGGGLTAHVLTYGASLQDLRLEGHQPPLILGFNTIEDYETHGLYFGATVGRFANRIANGRFEIDGTTYQTDKNFRNRHTLHGGSDAIGCRVWKIETHRENSVTLSIKDPAGTNGFPGNTAHTCTYTLEDNGTLAVEITSTTDEPTIASLAHHSYFILDGSGTCLDHEFLIDADHYLPVDADLIPTGDIAPVATTEFDFREPRTLREETQAGLIYDHNFCLTKKRDEIAKVTSNKSDVTLTVSTTEPGLQFYAGNGINVPVEGRDGTTYGPCSGFAFETQIWPDAPNHPNFPNAILHPDETRVQTTRYRFTK